MREQNTTIHVFAGGAPLPITFGAWIGIYNGQTITDVDRFALVTTLPNPPYGRVLLKPMNNTYVYTVQNNDLYYFSNGSPILTSWAGFTGNATMVDAHSLI